MPSLQYIHDRYHDNDITVLALCVSDTIDAANKWIQSHNYPFTYAFDPTFPSAMRIRYPGSQRPM